MITKDYIIRAPEGIHARPAAALVKLTRQFKAVIYLQKGEKRAPLNSLLNLLSVGAKGGDTITLFIEGEDESGAAEAVDRFFNELKE
jgi:phosphocarrier protein HPr